MGIPAVLEFQIFFTMSNHAVADDAPRSTAPYFTPATSSPKAPDYDGFLLRWLLLESINKPNRTNTVFTACCVHLNPTLYNSSQLNPTFRLTVLTHQ